MAKSFVHLHLHTEYSMLDGAARVQDVVATAASDGQPAIGITDHGNMYGVIDFYRAAREAGLTPVIEVQSMQSYLHFLLEVLGKKSAARGTGRASAGGRCSVIFRSCMSGVDEAAKCALLPHRPAAPEVASFVRRCDKRPRAWTKRG